MFNFLGRPGDLDFTEGREDAREALKAFENGDWARLGLIYGPLAPSDRYQLIHVLGELTKLDAEPKKPAEDADALTIMAGVRTGWAWRHRGGGAGASVNDKRANAMFKALEQASADLILASTRSPRPDSVAAAYAIRVGMGLDGDRGRLRSALQTVEHSGDQNVFAAYNHMMFVAPKWHGSFEEVAEVARVSAAHAHPAYAAVAARTHIEIWLYDTAMSDGEGPRRAYLRLQDPEVIAGIRKLDADFWRKRATVLLTHAERVFTHNNFAFLLSLAGQGDLLAPHLEALGRDITLLPWGYQVHGKYLGHLNDLRRQSGLRRLS